MTNERRRIGCVYQEEAQRDPRLGIARNSRHMKGKFFGWYKRVVAKVGHSNTILYALIACFILPRWVETCFFKAYVQLHWHLQEHRLQAVLPSGAQLLRIW